MSRKQQLEQELEKLSKRETRRECVTRLTAEISNARARTSVVDAVEFRREAYGLLATDMAKLLGISKGHYSDFVAGKRELPKKSVIKAMIIGVPMVVFSEYLREIPNKSRPATLIK